jgi:SagB-type dehydrogenase family enzyme
VTKPPLSANLARIVYGADEPPLDDLAENLHEASKLNASVSGLEMHGAVLLELHDELVWSSSRSVKEHAGLSWVDLPPPRLPEVTLPAVLAARRSRNTFAGGAVELGALATLLGAGYGVTHAEASSGDGPVFPHRTVPSGGGLYPLELYVLASEVDGLDPGVYHYHPLKHRLELLRAGSPRAALAPALVLDSFLEAAAGIVIAGVFWRSRFKYGLRGYRFTLLEAGQVAQNLVLAAAALGLRSCPCGGFYERRLDPLLEVDGVEESALVGVFVGGEP